MSFDDRLHAGLAGESVIARWMIGRGWTILPAYEKIEMDFKGPRILSASGELIAPDMLAFKFDGDGGQVHWIEAKTKAAFTWHRKTSSYQDGIDKRCWEDYIKVYRLAPWPVWLMFLHGPGHVAKDNPEGMIPPIGLFGNTLDKLANCIDHPSDKWGPSGMVYWRAASLRKIATWEEIKG